MKNRRDFLKTSALLIGSSFVMNEAFAAKKRGNVGVQLYSVRADMTKDPLGTLKKVAAMGYKNVEHANYINRKFYGYSASEFKKILDDLGLKMSSGHTVLDKNKHWDASKNDFNDIWKYTVEDAAICGQKHVISPWLDVSQRKSLSDLKFMMEVFNKSGELCKKSGMLYGYHNHDFEFSEKLEGLTLYDHILQNTDGQLVVHQLDIGNMYGGGGRAEEVIKKYPGRFQSMHVKDEIEATSKGPGKFESTIIGKGVVNTKKIVELGRKLGGTTEFIIEQESYQNVSALEAINEDLVIMKKWGYKG